MPSTAGELITETLDYQLVKETLVEEAIGTVVLAVTTYLVRQPPRGALRR